MKIALIELSLAHLAGAQKFAINVALVLRTKGGEVQIFTSEYEPRYFPEAAALKINVIPRRVSEVISGKGSTPFGKLAERFKRSVVAFENIKNIVQAMDRDFDILLCHNNYAYRAAYFYKKINPRARRIWIMHDPPWAYRRSGRFFYDAPRLFLSWLEAKMEKKFYSCVERVIVLDERNRNLAQRLGLQAEIVRGGLDFESFCAPVKDIEGKADFRIVGVGALSPYRRYEDIIKAVAILRRKGIAARATIVSKIAFGTEAYRRMLLDLTKSENVENFIDFRWEGVEEEVLRKILKDSDFYVFPNQIQIWGMAAFEAMAAGLPLIVSRSTSVAEILIDGKNALFVRPAHPEDIAEKLKMLIDNPQDYKEIAKNGQKFVKENLDWKKYAENLLRVISQLEQR
jgi:glycosyltransferase involved in cell wall biosynthesis